MKILEFDYVDAKGDKTHRQVLVLSKPSENYLTIDVTEFDNNDDFCIMLDELDTLRAKHKDEETQLLDSWGLSKIRAFKPSRMSNMVEK